MRLMILITGVPVPVADSNVRKRVSGKNVMSAYELSRLESIKANHEQLKVLGLATSPVPKKVILNIP